MKQKAYLEIYVHDVRVFESQEKGFNSILDAVKITEYYVSGYELEGYTKVTEIKLKPKFPKWETIYCNADSIELYAHGLDLYYLYKDRNKKNISNSIIQEIISMVKDDKKASIILRDYLREIGFNSDVIGKLDVIISYHNAKEIEKEKLNRSIDSDVTCEKKNENKKIKGQIKIYKIGSYLIKFVKHGDSIFSDKYIRKIEYIDLKERTNTKWETVWHHEESRSCFDHERIINEIKVAELLPCDLYSIIQLIQSDLESLYIYRDYLKYHGKKFSERNDYSFIEKGKNI